MVVVSFVHEWPLVELDDSCAIQKEKICVCLAHFHEIVLIKLSIYFLDSFMVLLESLSGRNFCERAWVRRGRMSFLIRGAG